MSSIDGWAPDRHRLSGTVLVRVGGRRRVLATGQADAERGLPCEEGTRFNVASLTKLITAVACCRLAERGGLDLEATVEELLPDAGIADAGTMRVMHLLAHTSGLPEEAAADGVDALAWLAAARTPLLFVPGSAWAYSNIGYGVLGAIVERVAGRSYYDAVRELVLDPADMTATAFDEPSDPDPPHASGYLAPSSSGRAEAADLWRGGPHGYAYSTVGDLERLVDGIVGRSLVDDRHARAILDGTTPTDQPGRRAGLAMLRETVGGVAVSTLSGAGPGISAWLDAAPGPGYLAIVLANRSKPVAHDVGLELRAHWLG